MISRMEMVERQHYSLWNRPSLILIVASLLLIYSICFTAWLGMDLRQSKNTIESTSGEDNASNESLMNSTQIHRQNDNTCVRSTYTVIIDISLIPCSIYTLTNAVLIAGVITGNCSTILCWLVLAGLMIPCVFFAAILNTYVVLNCFAALVADVAFVFTVIALIQPAGYVVVLKYYISGDVRPVVCYKKFYLLCHRGLRNRDKSLLLHSQTEQA